jgi:hypothetical protein
MTSATQTNAIPKSAIINGGVTATILIDCMAAMPCGGAKRASALMMNPEKAKKAPPTTPQPRAAMIVRA